VLVAGNVVFHLEVLYRGAADYGIRIAIAAVIALIALIGGRIVPSFTNNWLVRNNPGGCLRRSRASTPSALRRRRSR
jgi:uncharacterized protein involved in response to NO